jgi:hypothetical protein
MYVCKCNPPKKYKKRTQKRGTQRGGAIGKEYALPYPACPAYLFVLPFFPHPLTEKGEEEERVFSAASTS